MIKSATNASDKAELDRKLSDRGTTKGAPVVKPGPVVVAK